MSSYFVNSSFPVTLPGTGGGGGQAAESFLGQIPLYSSGYAAAAAADHPLRHYPAAAVTAAAAAVAYGASGSGVHQDKPYTTAASSYYQQAASGAYGGHRAAAGVGAGACDYAAAAAAAAAAASSFYRDKEHPCSLDEHQLVLGQDGMHRKAECKGLYGDAMDDKQPSSTPIYPWMQRMNACNGEYLFFVVFFSLPTSRSVFCIFYDPPS